MLWYGKTLLLSQPLHFGDEGGLPLKIIRALFDLLTIIVLGSDIHPWAAEIPPHLQRPRGLNIRGHALRKFHVSRRNRNSADSFAGRARGPWRRLEMFRKILSAAAIGAAAVIASASGASAAIVCQGHTCWHTHEAYEFPHEAGVVVHEDNWHPGPREKFAFREHEGRGYWRGSKWVGW